MALVASASAMASGSAALSATTIASGACRSRTRRSVVANLTARAGSDGYVSWSMAMCASRVIGGRSVVLALITGALSAARAARRAGRTDRSKVP